ncbi:MAG: hypothetical protein ACR2RD_18555 [Woeseiaceae bacterium]
MFTNKHVVVAMLVAPILAIMAWFAMDYFLSERPHASQPGADYRLIAKSNCRYDSGECDLRNGDFELSLRATEIAAATVTLSMQSRFPLQQAAIGFIDNDTLAAPSKMTSIGSNPTQWSAVLALPAGDPSTLGIVVSSNGSNYFAEAPTMFLQLER